jgi:hypothetical protein
VLMEWQRQLLEDGLKMPGPPAGPLL